MKLFLSVCLILAVTTPVYADLGWNHATATMSHSRSQFGAAAAGTKAIFVGGTIDPVGARTADIFDSTTGTWSTQTFAEPVIGGVGMGWGTKALFPSYNGKVHIYDSAADSWSMDQLPSGQGRVAMAVAATNGKIFFAGGYENSRDYDYVDVYDVESGKWTLDQLSLSRFGAAGAAAGNRFVAAGGSFWSNGFLTNRVDIYDTESNTWSISGLSTTATLTAATGVGDKAYIAGGYDYDVFRDDVDIYDAATGIWSHSNLSEGRQQIGATSIGKYALFAGGWRTPFGEPVEVVDTIDVLDTQTQLWSLEQLSVPRYDLESVTVGNYVLFAGGSLDGVSDGSNLVDIFYVPEPSSALLGMIVVAGAISIGYVRRGALEPRAFRHAGTPAEKHPEAPSASRSVSIRSRTARA
ncbi:MAG: hypothetical protein SGJ19_24695 [Planctomycetia bacterium]|nr:hypothetical protein [Planctomycetia bacterium]